MTYRTLREEVAIYIRDKIITGIYQPGDKIAEGEIANQLKVSRAPIREALMLMEREGLVTYNPNKGCTVKVLSPRDVWEIYLLRASLEILSVRLCNGQFDERIIHNMHLHMQQFEKVSPRGDLYECAQVDELFHAEIIAATGLSSLAEAWKRCNGMNAAMAFATSRTREIAFENQVPDHIVILDAIEAHEVELACQRIRHHYTVSCLSLFEPGDTTGETYFERLA